jgi:hypothetical protein
MWKNISQAERKARDDNIIWCKHKNNKTNGAGIKT